VNRKADITEYRAGWFGGFHDSGTSRTQPSEDKDYEWRDWFGGRECKRRRENRFFILHDRRYYKHFFQEGKYEWEIQTTPILKIPLARKDWQHQLLNLIIALSIANAVSLLILKWMMSKA
tara:strand:+ start:733 stop:1092 length:360 start_codon:yes stop_codon:yes gene_type:complete